MGIKSHARVLDGTAKSILVVEHQGIEIIGDKESAVTNTSVVATLFNKTGLYIISDTDNENTSIVAVINTDGLLSAVKIAGPATMTITKDNAATVNIYIENDVLKVQNLLGVNIDVEVKPYV
jgi:hypothetical protein